MCLIKCVCRNESALDLRRGLKRIIPDSTPNTDLIAGNAAAADSSGAGMFLKNNLLKEK